MKQIIRYISVVVLLMFSTAASARGGVESKVEIASLTNGTITSSMEGQTCTLTVTPAAGYYISKDDITVQKTVTPGAKTRGDINVAENLSLTGDDPAALSAARTYTFTIPEGYNAYVTAKFTACTKINLSVSMSGWTYGSEASSPTVTGNTGNATVTYSYAASGSTEFAATKPVNAGDYTVKAAVPAIGIYTAAEATASFTIARKAVTVTADDKSKEAGADDPELTATVVGLIGEDKVTYTLTRATGEDAGEYDITASGEANQGNYSVTFVAGKLTITAKAEPDKPAEPNVDVVNPEDAVTEGGETFYQPTEEIKEALKENFDTGLVLSGDASGEVKVNSDGELEFPEGKNVDIALTDQKKGDVVKLVFEGKMYGDSEKLALKNVPAASRGTRAKDDMELISGAEYEVLQSGNIVLTVAAQEAPVTLKGITSTPASTSGIRTIDDEQNAMDSWYDMNGRKLQGKPTRKGMYIHSGHKTIIK